jgi:hypothetical protein
MSDVRCDARMEKNKIIHDRRARAAKYQVGDNVMVLDEAKKSGTSNNLRKKKSNSVIEVGIQEKTVKINQLRKMEEAYGCIFVN